MIDPNTALSVGGSLVGGILGNKSSAKEAKKNREFQLMMATKGHQLEVADLRAAGLNPRLSAMGGSGASASGGSSAPQSDPITPAINSGLAARRNKAEVDNMEEQNKNLHETNKLLQAQAVATGAQAANYNAQTTATNLENIGRGIDAEWQQQFGVTGAGTKAVAGFGHSALSGIKSVPGIISKMNPQNIVKNVGSHFLKKKK